MWISNKEVVGVFFDASMEWAVGGVNGSMVVENDTHAGASMPQHP
jgi:hypothetical protein